MAQNVTTHSRDAGQLLEQLCLAADSLPGSVEEGYALWGDQLLQCPPSLEPARSLESLIRYVGQEYVASFCVPVPCEHGIDGLAQLCAAGLVDAAGVDPDIMDSGLMLYRSVD